MQFSVWRVPLKVSPMLLLMHFCHYLSFTVLPISRGAFQTINLHTFKNCTSIFSMKFIFLCAYVGTYLQVGMYPHPSSRDSKERIPFLQSNLINIFIFPHFFYKILPTLILCLPIMWHVFSKFVYSVTETMQEYHLKNPLTSFVNDTYWCIFVDIIFLAGISNLSDEKWEIKRKRTKYVSFVATIIIY